MRQADRSANSILPDRQVLITPADISCVYVRSPDDLSPEAETRINELRTNGTPDCQTTSSPNPVERSVLPQESNAEDDVQGSKTTAEEHATLFVTIEGHSDETRDVVILFLAELTKGDPIIITPVEKGGRVLIAGPIEAQVPDKGNKNGVVIEYAGEYTNADGNKVNGVITLIPRLPPSKQGYTDLHLDLKEAPEGKYGFGKLDGGELPYEDVEAAARFLIARGMLPNAHVALIDQVVGPNPRVKPVVFGEHGLDMLRIAFEIEDRLGDNSLRIEKAGMGNSFVTAMSDLLHFIRTTEAPVISAPLATTGSIDYERFVVPACYNLRTKATLLVLAEHNGTFTEGWFDYYFKGTENTLAQALEDECPNHILTASADIWGLVPGAGSFSGEIAGDVLKNHPSNSAATTNVAVTAAYAAAFHESISPDSEQMSAGDLRELMVKTGGRLDKALRTIHRDLLGDKHQMYLPAIIFDFNDGGT